jgi:hypothetical protein
MERPAGNEREGEMLVTQADQEGQVAGLGVGGVQIPGHGVAFSFIRLHVDMLARYSLLVIHWLIARATCKLATLPTYNGHGFKYFTKKYVMQL